jgi:hypothetical protein
MHKFTTMVVTLSLVTMIVCSCEQIRCGASAPTSEGINYRGKLEVAGDSTVNTSTNIWEGNYDYRIYGPNGARANAIPQHPSKNGDFIIYGVTYSHSPCVTVEQWQCGPLWILVEDPDCVTYYDSLTNDQLKTLQQNAAGEWVLPTITLQKKP